VHLSAVDESAQEELEPNASAEAKVSKYGCRRDVQRVDGPCDRDPVGTIEQAADDETRQSARVAELRRKSAEHSLGKVHVSKAMRGCPP
jgi:hypothetical protein